MDAHFAQNQWKDRWLKFWKVFKKSRNGIVGLVMLAVMILVAIFAPFITPYDSTSTESVTLVVI
jgi:ABC-type antimicrobial peptide transport system permease subunit